MQNGAVERRFCQYHQMTGGSFLVSPKDVEQSEKFLKFKALIYEGSNLTSEFKGAECCQCCHEAFETFATAVEHRVSCVDSLRLNSKSIVVSHHLQVIYIVARVKEMSDTCCKVKK